MLTLPSYVLLTPVPNEAESIELTIKSVVKQSVCLGIGPASRKASFSRIGGVPQTRADAAIEEIFCRQQRA
jgi:hypothetical protein